jgi:hypothetical protein
MFARNGSPLNMATMGVPPWNTIPTSEKAKVVERLTMTGPDTIVYEMTYSDPEVFTAPWTAALRLDAQRQLRLLRIRLPRRQRAGEELHHRLARRAHRGAERRAARRG